MKIYIVYRQDYTADEGYVMIKKGFRYKKKAEAYVKKQQQKEQGFTFNPWWIEAITVVV